MTRIRILLSATALVFVCTGAWAQAKAPTARALILSSENVGPDDAYARNVRDWSARFVAYLTQRAALPADRVRVLAESADAQAKPPAAECTLANVQAAFAALGRELTPQDQFVLVLLGYGSVTDPVAKLCLKGADLKATTLAEMLDALPTRKVIILNFAGGGAEFLEKYARPGRVVVSACGKNGQGGRAYFAEFFLAALETGKADADGDGTITLLETFNESARRCINWYHRQVKIPPPKNLPPDAPPGPRQVEVRTKEARRLFQKFYAGVGDLEMITPAQDEDDDVDPAISGLVDLQLRREATEHASLEDRVETSGALDWWENKHHPLTGKPGEPGALAARTVLGSPTLRPPVP